MDILDIKNSEAVNNFIKTNLQVFIDKYGIGSYIAITPDTKDHGPFISVIEGTTIMDSDGFPMGSYILYQIETVFGENRPYKIGGTVVQQTN